MQYNSLMINDFIITAKKYGKIFVVCYKKLRYGFGNDFGA